MPCSLQGSTGDTEQSCDWELAMYYYAPNAPVGDHLYHSFISETWLRNLTDSSEMSKKHWTDFIFGSQYPIAP